MTANMPASTPVGVSMPHRWLPLFLWIPELENDGAEGGENDGEEANPRTCSVSTL